MSNSLLATDGESLNPGWIALIVILVLILAAYLILIVTRIKKCPSDKIMVVYGAVGKNKDGTARSSRCIHGGVMFVWPVFQAYSFIDLTPIRFELAVRNAFTRDGRRADAFGKFAVGVSTEPETMQHAAERIRGLPVTEVEELAKDIILGQLRLVIAENDFEDTLDGHNRFLNTLSCAIEAEIRQIGLKLISLNVTEFTIKE
ncbi:MAG: flotillin family protein [Firmicutes bacterium]|nr:flotillin family protein [Bacillota bacterium]